MKCCKRIPHPGANDLHSAARRCTSDGTHALIAVNGIRIPGTLCEDHARAIITEYANKLGEFWTMLPVDEYGTPLAYLQDGHDDS